MNLKPVKIHLVVGLVFLSIFLFLMSVRTGLLPGRFGRRAPVSLVPADGARLPDRDSWMNILHGGRKIGYSHSRFFSLDDGGYGVEDNMFLRLVTMGIPNDVRMKTSAVLNNDFTVNSFQLSVSSGLFSFSARGVVSGSIVRIDTTAGGKKSQSMEIPLSEKPYTSSGLFNVVANSGLAPGESATFTVFDPSVMASVPLVVTVAGKEKIEAAGRRVMATKVSMEARGIRQYAWIGEDGDVLREEGPMGMVMVKTTRHDAVSGGIEAPQDITKLASVRSNVKLPDPQRLKVLKVLITGISSAGKEALSGGRQSFSGDMLTIRRESLDGLENTGFKSARYDKWLRPGPFIQSDDSEIRSVSERVVSGKRSAREKASSLVEWVYRNIEKKPVLSLPNALSTLQNRQGDCNEHATLLAGFSRATGIPAKSEKKPEGRWKGTLDAVGGFAKNRWNTGKDRDRPGLP